MIFLFFFRTKIVLWHLFYELRPIVIEWKARNTNSFDKIKENKDAQNVYVVVFINSKKKAGLLMLPSPIQRMTIPVLWQRAVFSAHGIIHHVLFFVYHLRDCGMALLVVLRENGNLLEKRSTLTSIHTYIYNLCITNLKVTSFFFSCSFTYYYSSNCKHFDRFIGENCNFGCTADANVCVKIQKGVIFRIFVKTK